MGCAVNQATRQIGAVIGVAITVLLLGHGAQRASFDAMYGLLIALALSLPAGPTRDLLLAATFAAVLFSVLIQRATLGRLIERGKVPHGEGNPPETIH